MVGASTVWSLYLICFQIFSKGWLTNLQMNTLMGDSFILIKSELPHVCTCPHVQKHLSDISVKSAWQIK